MAVGQEVLSDFINEACAPLDQSHSSGTLEHANNLLASHPEIATASIYTAAIVGDDSVVRKFIDEDSGNATAKGGPRNWDPLTYLCFSRYLRLDRWRTNGFLRAATALLDAGANPNTGWFENDHQPTPEWESALYGAAGVAHNADLTRLLIERGADPNDGEVPYHTPESYDNDALAVLVESGKLSDDSLATMLLRKADWHDYEGIKFLLAKGADPNRHTHWGNTPLQHAVQRDNSLEIVTAMLDHGGDPLRASDTPGHSRDLSGIHSAAEIAAYRGRRDLLDLFEQRGFSIKLSAAAALVAACARDDAKQISAIVEQEPQIVRDVLQHGGRILSLFSANGNVEGIELLLDLGVQVDAKFQEGNGYFAIAPNSTALHVASWRAQHSAVKLLIDRGANVNARDGRGQTPLALAVKACVDSYWTGRRTPDSVKSLLDAGASTHGIASPSGYKEVDDLIASHH
ncbi:MAG TPA: ankyrin repeat domain-containing protein [Gemmatimonadaceae bacterium]|nr:ankyrin repeat domain-containing protein [Gemmatimonadaceae bacterium]